MLAVFILADRPLYRVAIDGFEYMFPVFVAIELHSDFRALVESFRLVCWFFHFLTTLFKHFFRQPSGRFSVRFC
jgi:hypothetical protein